MSNDLERWMDAVGGRATDLADYSTAWYERLEPAERRIWFPDGKRPWNITRPTASRWIRGESTPRHPAAFRMIADFLFDRATALLGAGGHWPHQLPDDAASIEKALKGIDRAPEPPHIRPPGLTLHRLDARVQLEAPPGSGALAILRADLGESALIVYCLPGDAHQPFAACGRILTAARRQGLLTVLERPASDPTLRSQLAAIPLLGRELELAPDDIPPRAEALAALCRALIAELLAESERVIVLDDAQYAHPTDQAVLATVLGGLGDTGTRLYEVHGQPAMRSDGARFERVTGQPPNRLADSVQPHVRAAIRDLDRVGAAARGEGESPRILLGRLDMLLRLILNGHRPLSAEPWPESLGAMLSPQARQCLYLMKWAEAPVQRAFVAEVLDEIGARDGLSFCETSQLLDPVPRPEERATRARGAPGEGFVRLADRCLVEAVPGPPPAELRAVAARRLRGALEDRQVVLLDQDPGVHWALLARTHLSLGEQRRAADAFRGAHISDRTQGTGRGSGSYLDEAARVLDAARRDPDFDPVFMLDLARARWYQLITGGDYDDARRAIDDFDVWLEESVGRHGTTATGRRISHETCRATLLCGRAHLDCRHRPAEADGIGGVAALRSIGEALGFLLGCDLLGSRQPPALRWLQAHVDPAAEPTASAGGERDLATLAAEFIGFIEPVETTIGRLGDTDLRDALAGRLERLVITLLKEAGLALAKLGRLSSAEAVLGLARHALEATNRDRQLDPARRIRAALSLHRGFVAWRGGRHSRAFRLLYRAAEDAATSADRRLGWWARVGRVHLLLQRGPEALAEAEEIVDALRGVGEQASDQLLSAYSQYLRGAVSQHRLVWQLIDARRITPVDLLRRGVTRPLEGEQAERLRTAVDDYRTARERTQRSFETLYAWMRLAEVALLFPGQTEGGAADPLTEIDGFVARCDAYRARREHGIGLRLRAVALARAGRMSEAMGTFDDAIVWLQSVGDAVEEARTAIWRAIFADETAPREAIRIVMACDQFLETRLIMDAMGAIHPGRPRDPEDAPRR